ncbi:MAG TPA: histidine--tRNA ligase [Candidatus Hydrogenedentes bacterium]|nr:histidine--tRNA ligase [Candidatus Hydrogenedentota bacterium]
MGEKKQLVEPRTLKGFQDLLPEQVIPRQRLLRVIESVFERYGYAPLETPALEYLDALLGTGGEGTNKELFRLESPENEPIALRFDLTVPFARLLAQYPDRLKPPFRRYAIGPVWRADKPGVGRFRQFVQCDIDVAGAPTVAADGEIVAVMADVMRALGVTRFVALINNRKVIDALLDGCGVTEESVQKHVLRVIDKLGKVGADNVRLELGPGRIDESGDPIAGVKLDDATIDRILGFIAIKGDTRAAIVAALEQALPESKAAREAVAEMRELAEALEALEVDEAHARFDPSLARGLDYYTGPIFEMTLPDAPQFGSVMGGGRYDGLVARFMDRPIPCTGMSVGVDRLVAALLHLGCLAPVKTPVQALVVTMGNVPKTETLKLAAELRGAGLCVETFFASRKKMQMGNQLSHADHYGIPVAVILGEDELRNGVVAVKDLRAGKAEREHIEDREAYREAGKTGQVTVPRSEAAAAIRAIVGGNSGTASGE